MTREIIPKFQIRMKIDIFIVAHGHHTNGTRRQIDGIHQQYKLNSIRLKISALLFEIIDEETYHARYRMFKMFKLITTETGQQAQLIVNDVDLADCKEIHVLPSGGPGGMNRMVPDQIPQRSGWFSRKWQFAASRTRTESLENWFEDEAAILSSMGFYSEKANLGTNFITCWHCDNIHNCWAMKNTSSIVRSHLYFKPNCPLHKKQDALENIRRCEETIRVGVHMNNTLQMILLNKNLCLERELHSKLREAELNLMNAEPEETGIKCGICLEATACVINLPCRHESTCITCHKKLMTGNSDPRCQLCGANIAISIKSFRDYSGKT